MKSVIIVFLFISFFHSYSQTCNCDAFIKPDYVKGIKLLDKPNGKIISIAKNDTINNDFLSLTILKNDTNYFFVKIVNEMSGKSKEGWIKKTEPIGVYVRNYGDSFLNLYTKPSKSSIVKSKIDKWYNDLYQVLKCKENWIYVKLKVEGKVFEGWLEPEMQCANQYTTCN